MQFVAVKGKMWWNNKGSSYFSETRCKRWRANNEQGQNVLWEFRTRGQYWEYQQDEKECPGCNVPL